MELDASDTGVRAVISQNSIPDQKFHPFAYFPCLSPAEDKSDVGNRELLWKSGVTGLREWSSLSSSEHTTITWSISRYLNNLNPVKPVGYWFFGCFKFILTFCPGFKIVPSDALSHQHVSEETPPSPETIIIPYCIIATVI